MAMMRYSEIPRDFSSDSLRFSEVIYLIFLLYIISNIYNSRERKTFNIYSIDACVTFYNIYCSFFCRQPYTYFLYKKNQ